MKNYMEPVLIAEIVVFILNLDFEQPVTRLALKSDWIFQVEAGPFFVLGLNLKWAVFDGGCFGLPGKVTADKQLFDIQVLINNRNSEGSLFSGVEGCAGNIIVSDNSAGLNIGNNGSFVIFSDNFLGGLFGGKASTEDWDCNNTCHI